MTLFVVHMHKASISISKPILNENDIHAEKLRAQFKKNNTLVLNVVSSPGSGKTELVTVLAKHLIQNGKKVAVIVGDLATDNDAVRIRSSGAETYQINTNGTCHLDARMIQKALAHLDWIKADILIIENVGNLVCPASYDLGEALRIVLLSVTEGEDKPAKYPSMFHSSQLCVITKMDLAEACEFNLKRAKDFILDVAPHITIVETSAKRDEGINKVMNYVNDHIKNHDDEAKRIISAQKE